MALYSVTRNTDEIIFMKKIFTLILTLVSLMSFSQSTTIVISQVYGAGGNSGALFNVDYVELHNISTSPVSLAGDTIKYASSTATSLTWSGRFALPNVSIPAGGYFLIQMDAISGTATGAAIPTPDVVVTPSIAMSASNGKVALVSSSTPTNSCSAGNIIDFVGYGSANCSETSPTAALSVILAAVRKNNGCTDTDNNANDLDVVAPAPRNSAATAVICSGTPSPTLSATTIADFGNVVILTNSASQSFSLTGANLTGAPGTININAPSTDFQVSNNNTTWGASTTVAFTSATLASTLVYVRFTPQTVGLKTGNVTISGGGANTTVAVRGTGILGAGPLLSAGTLTAFGNICVNTLGGPNSFSVTGTNLTAADVTVGPLSGYSFSSNAGGPFTSTLALTQPGGSFTATVFVQFAPTAVQSYSGNIPVSGGGASAINVAASGAGVNNTATVTTGAASAITFTTATLAGSVTASGCSPVTSYGVEYSTTNGFTLGTVAASTNISGGNFTVNLTALTAATRYYYKAFAINGGGKVYGTQLFFNTAAPTIISSALTDFGSVCVGTTAGPNSFNLTSPSLVSGPVTVGPLAGYTFSTTATGTYTPTLTINQSGGAFTQTVFVKFAPTVLGIFDGNIPVSGGGASVSNVAATGSAQNRPAVITTAPTPAIILTPTSATLTGKINDQGCSPITEYGIIYSGISGFPNSMGTRVISSDLTGTDYSVTLTGLVPSTTYYYKAYAKTSAGISYGNEESFATTSLPGGLVIYNVPIARNGAFHFTLNNVLQGHYGVNIYNSTGQLVFRKDLLLQVNFIDETFNLPGNLAPGVYIFQLDSYTGYLVRRSFMVK